MENICNCFKKKHTHKKKKTLNTKLREEEQFSENGKGLFGSCF